MRTSPPAPPPECSCTTWAWSSWRPAWVSEVGPHTANGGGRLGGHSPTQGLPSGHAGWVVQADPQPPVQAKASAEEWAPGGHSGLLTWGCFQGLTPPAMPRSTLQPLRQPTGRGRSMPRPEKSGWPSWSPGGRSPLTDQPSSRPPPPPRCGQLCGSSGNGARKAGARELHPQGSGSVAHSLLATGGGRHSCPSLLQRGCTQTTLQPQGQGPQPSCLAKPWMQAACGYGPRTRSLTTLLPGT